MFDFLVYAIAWGGCWLQNVLQEYVILASVITASAETDKYGGGQDVSPE